MSLEDRVTQLERSNRILSLWLTSCMTLAAGACIWAILAGRQTDVVRSENPLAATYPNGAFETLAVRHLLVANEKNEVIAELDADSDGFARFTMSAGGTDLLTLSLDDHRPRILINDSFRKAGVTLGLRHDGAKLYLHNQHGGLGAGMMTDAEGFGSVFTARPGGDPLVLVGRGENDAGTVAAFGEGRQPVQLTDR